MSQVTSLNYIDMYEQEMPSAIAYGKRLSMLASMYGERSVLATLLLFTKDKAATWFYGLEAKVTATMADSIDEWKIQPIRRFHTNPSGTT